MFIFLWWIHYIIIYIIYYIIIALLVTRITKQCHYVHTGRGRTMWWYSVFANILGCDTLIWIKNGRYSVFHSTNGDRKIQFLIENTTVTVFVQKFNYDITVFFEKINGNKIIQNLVRPPPLYRWVTARASSNPCCDPHEKIFHRNGRPVPRNQTEYIFPDTVRLV